MTSTEGIDALTDMLNYHVVPVVLASDNLSVDAMVPTAQGGDLTVQVTGCVPASEPDILALNGVLTPGRNQ